MGFLENLRKWIDGEEAVEEGGPARPRSKWDDFLVAVAREIEHAMQREMFTPPGGPTYIPREYIVFLNPEDDAEWQGEKREGLERGLRHVLTERARELAGDNEFQTRTLTIELRTDAALERGRFRVQHVWDQAAQKTMVKPRRRAESSAEAPTLPLPDAGEDPATVVRPRPAAPTDEEATLVRPRKPAEPAFTVAVRRVQPDNLFAPAETRPFFKDEISIGRGSRQVEVDLKLEGDLEVSRKHATLGRRDGQFFLSCHGANPITVGDREIAAGETAPVQPGERIQICSYELVISAP